MGFWGVDTTDNDDTHDVMELIIRPTPKTPWKLAGRRLEMVLDESLGGTGRVLTADLTCTPLAAVGVILLFVQEGQAKYLSAQTLRFARLVLKRQLRPYALDNWASPSNRRQAVLRELQLLQELQEKRKAVQKDA
jgi:hypothetical protein